MSRTKKRGGVSSPIKKYISFSGSTGTFKYYDKKKEDTVELDSIDIIILDERASISGFNEGLGARMTSNMILATDSKKEELKVMSFVNGKPKVVAEGLWDDIKADVKAVGGKFTQNLICLADLGEGYEVINLQLSGVALGEWIDFSAQYPNDELEDYVITLGKGVLSKRVKGKNVEVTKKEEAALDAKLAKNPRAKQPIWFYVLDFKLTDLSEELSELAIKEDEKLQSYFEATIGKSVDKSVSTSEPSAPEDEEEEEKDDLPF